MTGSPPPSEFFHYLATCSEAQGEAARLPSLDKLSQKLHLSVASLREQLEVARALGLVEVRPRTGIRRLAYTFLPAVGHSLSYAMALDPAYFYQFAELRNHLEAAYWNEAVTLLTPEDHQALRDLIRCAWEKLRGPQVHIPHAEHRELHLTIFRRLENTFVQGLLEAYWDAYVAVGLNLYADYGYLQQVWTFHEQMVESICSGRFADGYQALVEHRDLLYHHPAARLAESSSTQT